MNDNEPLNLQKQFAILTKASERNRTTTHNLLTATFAVVDAIKDLVPDHVPRSSSQTWYEDPFDPEAWDGDRILEVTTSAVSETRYVRVTNEDGLESTVASTLDDSTDRLRAVSYVEDYATSDYADDLYTDEEKAEPGFKTPHVIVVIDGYEQRWSGSFWQHSGEWERMVYPAWSLDEARALIQTHHGEGVTWVG